MSNDNIQIDIIVNLQGLESIQRLSGAMRGLEGQIGKTTKQQRDNTDTNYRNIKSWGDLSGHLTKVEQDLDAVWRAGVHLKALGGDLIGISKDIINTGLGIVDAYREYDYWLRRAGVALNTNATWQKLLDERIQETAISVGLLKPEEVAEAFNIWGAATGVTVDSMEDLEFVAAAVKDVILATAGAGGSLEGNLKGVSGVLAQFNLDMSEAGHVTRVLTLMTERTQADFGDLSSAMSYIGPLAASLGITFDDVAQMLGVLADNAQKGSRGGRGLSMVIEGLSAPSAKAANALDMVVNGFKKGKREWSKVAFPKGDFIGMRGIVVELARGLMGATDAQRGYVYSTAFSNNATRALIPLIEDTIALWRKDKKAMEENRTAMDEQKYSLENAGEFFANMSTAMTDSINAVIGSFQNSFFPIIQLVAVRIMELAKPVLGELKKALNGITEWLKANPWAVDLAVQVGAVIAIALGLAGAFFSIIGTLILLGAGIGFFVKGLGAVVFAFSVLGGVVAGVAAAIASNTGGIRDSLVRLFNEIADLIAPAIDVFDDVAVTIRDIPALVGPHVEGFFEGLAGAIDTLTDAIKQLKQDPAMAEVIGLLGTFAGVTLGVVVSLKALGAVFGSVLGFLWSLARVTGGVKILGGLLIGLPGPLKLVAVIAGAVAAVFYAWENNTLGFRDAVMQVVAWVQANLPAAIATVEGIINTIITKGQELINIVVPAVMGFVNAFITGMQTLWGIVQPILAAIWAPFDRLITYGIPALIELLGRLWEAWAPVFQQLAETVVGTFVNYILPALETFMQMVQEHLMPLLAELAEWFRVAWDVIVTVVGAAIGFIVKVITEFLIWIAPYVQGVLDVAIRIFGHAFNAILSVVSAVLGAIADVIRGVMEYIRGFIGVIMGLIKGDWGAVWDGIKLMVKGIWDAISGIVKGALNVLGTIIDTGLRFVTGIFEFIFGMEPGSIYAKIKGFVDTIINFGKSIIDGLVKGIGGAVSGAVTSVTGFVGDIIDGIKDFLGIASPARIMLSIGENIVRGLWNGILAAKDWIIARIQDFIDSVIPGPIKEFLGIQSPSKMMAELGGYIVEGLAVGITNADDALIAMKQTTNDLYAVASGGADRISMALDNATEASLGTGISLTTANKKVIRLEVEVTSPDGSVSQLDTQQLADLIKGPDLVSALEHMAANV